jgi:hypothetical protein
VDRGILPISGLISGCNSFIPIIMEVSWNSRTPIEDVLKLVKLSDQGKQEVFNSEPARNYVLLR